ncbi:hypothetical protein DERP_014936 [Dermatophagoides pteronyssinus]|uniref:Uncharacterized protein n=1 Tax=Dermatophagoides pteronyssinus TaxID=6956 RepID=A0ABQ8JX32_DERPT|nr:hypothetical protein DERP_014936 [Dermatophagoides pteronyssinus]
MPGISCCASKIKKKRNKTYINFIKIYYFILKLTYLANLFHWRFFAISDHKLIKSSINVISITMNFTKRIGFHFRNDVTTQMESTEKMRNIINHNPGLQGIKGLKGYLNFQQQL